MQLSKYIFPKVPEICFLAIICSLPFIDFLAPVTLILTIVTAAIFFKKEVFLENLKKRKTLWLLLGYFVLCACSYTVTTDIAQTTDRVFKNIAFLLTPLAFLLVNPQEKLLKKTLKFFLYALIAFCVFSLLKLGYNYATRFHESHWYNFIQASMYHKYLPEDAMQLNTGLIILLFGNYNRNMKLMISVLFLFMIVLFGVRLGLVIYLIIILIYFIQNLKLFLNLKTLLIVVGCIAFSFFLIENSRYVNDKFYDTLEKIGFDTKDKVGETGEAYHNINLRSHFWSASWKHIKQKPLLGHGAGMEKKLMNAEFQKQGLDLSGFNSHNQFLSSFFQFGIAGPLIILFIFGLLLIKAIKQRRQKIIMILGVMFLSMITESYLEIQQGLFYFCMMIPLLAYLLMTSVDQSTYEQN